MNKQINLEPSFDDITLYKIIDKIENISQLTLYTNFKKNEFLDILLPILGKCTTFSKREATVLKVSNKLDVFYTLTYVIGEKIAITYIETNYSSDDKISIDSDVDNEIDSDVNNEIDSDVNIIKDVTIYYDITIDDTIKNLLEQFNDVVYKDDTKSIFYTIGMDSYGFSLSEQKIETFDMDIELHYGKKFVEEYQDIHNNLKTKYHGLILAYGPPGTGKTSIIRYLIANLCNDKKIIYVPAYMIEQLANPEFISFLQNHKKSILILEDAEFALQSRNEEYGQQAVSNLLNITNGLLNDATQIQVIATFNMDKKKIDEALLRPGRLLNEWKFDKLSIDDSKKLAEFLGKDIKITTPMTVAEIYAGKVQKLKNIKKHIGFKKD